MAVLRDYHESMGELIFRYEGTLERFLADGIMSKRDLPLREASFRQTGRNLDVRLGACDQAGYQPLFHGQQGGIFPRTFPLAVSPRHVLLFDVGLKEALFCKLHGFSAFADASEAEDVMAVLRDYHESMGELIFRYEGTLERFLADGIMSKRDLPLREARKERGGSAPLGFLSCAISFSTGCLPPTRPTFRCGVKRGVVLQVARIQRLRRRVRTRRCHGGPARLSREYGRAHLPI